MTISGERRGTLESGFKPFSLSGEKTAVLIPDDINLQIPSTSSVTADRLHSLVYIPWDEKYLDGVSERLMPFFREVLSHLDARTTNVHVAKCLPFVGDLISEIGGEVDRDVVGIALILHDSGWSKMSEEEIADSLAVTGLDLTDRAKGPKEKHVVLGKEIAEEILEAPQNISSLLPEKKELTLEQKDLIYKAILYHDKPLEITQNGEIPIEVKIVCDADHLWSFTHENFWQDVVRKGISPPDYAQNLARDLDGYFITEAGKRKARALLAEREEEVGKWKELQSS